MFNGLISFLRRLDPAWDYAIGFQQYVNDFSMEHHLAGLPGPVDGEYEVTWAGGLAVLGAYRRKVDAERHLARAQRENRTFSRIIHHNAWRLILWARPSADLDDVIG